MENTLTSATKPVTQLDVTNESKIPNILSSVGMIGGLYYAHTKKLGFWGYVGYAVLGSVVGGTVGSIVSTVIKK